MEDFTMGDRTDTDCQTCVEHCRGSIQRHSWIPCAACGIGTSIREGDPGYGRQLVWSSGAGTDVDGKWRKIAVSHESDAAHWRTCKRPGTYRGRQWREWDTETRTLGDTDRDETGETIPTETEATPPPIEAEVKVEAPAPSGDAFGDLVWAAVEPRVRSVVDQDAMLALVRNEVAKTNAIKIEVTRWDGAVKDMGGQHPKFGEAVRMCAAMLNGGPKAIALVGPAGSGKTFTAPKIAEALGIPYASLSIGPSTMAHSVAGFLDATGTFRDTAAYRMYTHGGLLLLDEFDSGSPAALTELNGVIGNLNAAFACGNELRHNDFVVLVAMNTLGRGATAEYNGRSKLDDASLDRLAICTWGYDVEHEKRLGAGLMAAYGDNPKILEWMRYLHGVRAAAEAQGIEVTVSTRSLDAGARLIAQDFSIAQVAEQLLLAGLGEDSHEKLSAAGNAAVMAA